MRFQAATAEQIESILSSFVPVPTYGQTSARDWAMAEKLDKKGDDYYAVGNERMGAACRKAALNAANRAAEADKHDPSEPDLRGYPSVK